MLKHYFKIAFRNIWKYKTQSLIAIFGLAFGIACFVPALYWLRYETSYDSFYPDAEHIYRIYCVEKQSGKVNTGVPGILEKKLHEQFPVVEASTVCMSNMEDCKTNEIPHIKLRTLYADSTFFNIFPQTIVSGDARHPLQIMNNMVLTETMAIRLFGDVEKAIGQHVQTKMRPSHPPYIVTAVIKDPPPNTNMQFDVMIFHGMLQYYSGLPEEVQWSSLHLDLYVKLNPGTDIERFAEELRDFTSHMSLNDNIELRMLAVSDIRHHLNPSVPFTLNFIRLFLAAGILLLFSALFNFLNLQIDVFRQRIRELHQRTVHGAKGRQLIGQMIFEFACTIILALLLGCCFAIMIRPAFSGLLDISMEMPELIYLFVFCGIDVMVLLLLIGFIIFWRLSRLAMGHLAKRKITGQPILRRMAVTLQLVVSFVFIVATLVVMMQMRFVSRKDLGFDQNGIIQVSMFLDMSGKVGPALQNELKAIPQIESFTDAFFAPEHSANPFTRTVEVEWQGKPAFEKPAFDLILTDSRFAETFGLKMLMGEWWSESKTQKVVLNEQAIRVMGLIDPVGSVISIPSFYDNSIMEEHEVVGVVNDFHTLSLRNPIQPVIFVSSPDPFNVLYIRVNPDRKWEVIQQITAKLPDIDEILSEVHVTPMNELYDRLNQSEQAGLKMFSVLAIVCLLISLFGIYAVASASTQHRRKEIAIRKVVGAGACDIVGIFFREYILQVILAGAFALPVAYIAMSRWLQGYAYRTNIPWWLLAGVITGIVAVVLATVLGQVIRAAGSNPAEVVKSE